MTTWSTERDADTARRLAEQERELARLQGGGRRLAGGRGGAADPHGRDFTSVSGRAVEPVYTALDPPADQQRATGLARRVPVHPRHPSHHVSRSALDHAPVRRLRHRRGHQRTVQVPARARPDRLVGRVRFPDADGLRLRPSPLRGRGRQVRRGDLEPRRHGDPVRRHSAGPGLDLDDDQRAGGDAVLLLRRRGGAPGRAHRPAAGHHPERHPQGVHGAARLDLPGGARAQDHRRPVRMGGGAHAQVEHHLHLGLPHPRGRRRRPRRSSPSRSPTASATWSTGSPAGWTWISSRPGSRSSGTCTTTSSRRSPSCAPPGGSGRGTCASATARAIRGAGGCGFTARRRA